MRSATHLVGSPTPLHSRKNQWLIASQNLFHQKGHGLDPRLDVQLPSDYTEMNRLTAAQQLAKAGLRLAQLFNAIQWH